MELKINNAEQVIEILNNISEHTEDNRKRAGLMRRIAGTMRTAVITNFEQGGRPAWLGIKYRSGIPLNKTGKLKKSIQQRYDQNTAIVGTNEKYAAIHQFGGVIVPKTAKCLAFKIGGEWVMTKKVEIPARPFLTLSEQDEEDILLDVQDYWRSIIK